MNEIAVLKAQKSQLQSMSLSELKRVAAAAIDAAIAMAEMSAAAAATPIEGAFAAARAKAKANSAEADYLTALGERAKQLRISPDPFAGVIHADAIDRAFKDRDVSYQDRLAFKAMIRQELGRREQQQRRQTA